jgi:hypothetical protein
MSDIEKSLLEHKAIFSRTAPEMSAAARAALVNRTHRIVRERAQVIAARRSRIRSLWVPIAVCSSLLIILCTAVWSILQQDELTPTGVPDSSDQFLVLLLWFLPVSLTLLGIVWFRHNRVNRSGGEFTQ